MSDSPGVVGQGGLAARTLPDEAEARRQHSIAEAAGLGVFAPIELEKIEGSNGLLAFTGSGPDQGTLWAQGTRHHVDVLGRDRIRVVFEGSPPTPRYLIAANAENPGAPTTLAEWEAKQAVRAVAIERQEKEAAAKRDRLRRSAEPFIYDDGARDGERLTLRAAGEAVSTAGGKVEVLDGRLVVSLPPSARLTLGLPSRAAKAVSRLYLAEAAVIEAAPKRGGDVDVSKLRRSTSSRPGRWSRERLAATRYDARRSPRRPRLPGRRPSPVPLPGRYAPPRPVYLSRDAPPPRGRGRIVRAHSPDLCPRGPRLADRLT